MGMASTPGRTEDDMKENTSRTKSTDKVSTFGLMERSTTGCGKTGNSMGMVTFTIRALKRQNGVDGKMASGLSGIKKIRKKNEIRIYYFFYQL